MGDIPIDVMIASLPVHDFDHDVPSDDEDAKYVHQGSDHWFAHYDADVVYALISTSAAMR